MCRRLTRRIERSIAKSTSTAQPRAIADYRYLVGAAGELNDLGWHERIGGLRRVSRLLSNDVGRITKHNCAATLRVYEIRHCSEGGCVVRDPIAHSAKFFGRDVGRCGTSERFGQQGYWDGSGGKANPFSPCKADF